MSACSSLCGWCGRCSEAWEREDDASDPEYCATCDQPYDEGAHWPFCSLACRNNYDGPPDDPDGPWSGGFAENH